MGGELLETNLNPWGIAGGVALSLLLIASLWVEADGWWYNRKNKDDHD